MRIERLAPTLIVEFTIEVLLNSSLSSIAVIDNLMNNTVKPLLQDLVQNGTFNISADIGLFTLRHDSLKTPGYGYFDCRPGEVLSSKQCCKFSVYSFLFVWRNFNLLQNTNQIYLVE